MRYTKVLALLCLMWPLSGCCKQIPTGVVAQHFWPMGGSDEMDGTFDDVPTKGHGSLWSIFSGQEFKQKPGSTVRIRIRSNPDGKLVAVRLVNGVERGRVEVAFTFPDGYVRFSRASFFSIILFTGIGRGCYAAATDTAGNLHIYETGQGVLFILVIPAFPDVFPRWQTFRRVQ